MHIGIFTNNYLPNPYGVSASVEGFRKGLIAAGHRVSVFAPTWHGQKYTDAQDVYRYPSLAVPTKVAFSLVVPYAPKLDKKIEACDFDIIHAQHPNLLGTQAHRWAKQKDIPLIFTWHSLYDRYAHYVPFVPEAFAGKWMMKTARAFAQSADHVIVPTASVQKIILQQGLSHKRIHIIPSGVDEELFAHADGHHIREQYNIPTQAQLIVSISRLTKEKNVRFLAHAIKKVLAQNPQTYFLFGGEGDLLIELKKILYSKNIPHSTQRVIFPGKIARSDVKNILAAADLFVYASTSETQGTIITEAMYMGVPIVAVRASGVEDLIVEGTTGILTREATSDLSYAVLRCLSDRHAHQSCGQKARAYAKKHYTVTACTKKLIDVYSQAIDEHHQRPTA